MAMTFEALRKAEKRQKRLRRDEQIVFNLALDFGRDRYGAFHLEYVAAMILGWRVARLRDTLSRLARRGVLLVVTFGDGRVYVYRQRTPFDQPEVA
jgi:hypothetical protein